MDPKRAMGIRWAVAPLALGLATLVSAAGPVYDDFDYVIAIRDHRFNPESVTVLTGKPVRFYIDNKDSGEEVFACKGLGVRQAVAGRSQAVASLGPLTPGEYACVGEKNPGTARGVIVVREPYRR